MNVTGAPFVKPPPTDGTPGNAPPNPVTSTRLVTYFIHAGTASATVRFVIVLSGIVTVSAYVTTSPICT